MKSFIALSVAIYGFLLCPFVAEADFVDLPTSHPSYEAILYLRDQGALSGYQDGTFKSENKVTRAELAKILSSLRADPPVNCKKDFTDVNTNDWFYPYICRLSEEGIVAGYGDGTFRPGNNVNFIEAAKMIIFSLDIQIPQGGETWFEPFVTKLGDQKAIPISIQSFDQMLTRGEVAEIIYRLKLNLTSKASRSSNLQLFQWPRNSPITAIDAQYMPFTEENYEQALGNNILVLFFDAPWCDDCRKTDQLLIRHLRELPPNTLILKVDFQDSNSIGLKNILKVKEPNTFLTIDMGGNLQKRIFPKTIQEINAALDF
ncbi:MAG TPA: S-layer homology domain-containing protein [Candidatus Gracilibacteria bacterium]